MRQTITVRAAVGDELPQQCTAMLILTELQALAVSAGSNDLSAGPTPELLAFVSSLERKQLCCEEGKQAL